MDVKLIQARLAEFAAERDWDQFHDPKNLAMALAGEAGELIEIFQWLSGESSRKEQLSQEQLDHIAEELADVTIYALRLCDKLDIDIGNAVTAKIEKNADRYPVSLAKGNATKYSEREP